MKSKLNVLFVCNRGGHFSQMMALKDLFPLYNSMLVTDNKIDFDLDIPCRYMESFRQRSFPWFYFMVNVWQYLKIGWAFRPDVVISTGANLAVPMFMVGKLMGSKLVFIESRARVYTKSSTGRLVGKWCSKIIVQWPEMLKLYPRAEYWGQLM